MCADDDLQEGGDEEAAGERSAIARNCGHQLPRRFDEEQEASGHAKYRTWCRACIAGRGRADAHVGPVRDDDDALSTVAIDYVYSGQAQCQDAARQCLKVEVSSKVRLCERSPERTVREENGSRVDDAARTTLHTEV